jgi:RNA recognition motif-containing protein
VKKEDQTESKFAFVCFNDDNNNSVGPESANRAVEQEHDKVYEGQAIYVKEALKKNERDQEKRREQLRFKNSKKRCNLYVKNFPPNTTEPQLREFFQRYGDIESIKLFPKEGEALYAFVCYKSPDHAALARQQLNMQTFNGKQLYVNHYELKEVRKIQQEEARDKADFQNHKRAHPTNITTEFLNNPQVV